MSNNVVDTIETLQVQNFTIRDVVMVRGTKGVFVAKFILLRATFFGIKHRFADVR